MIDHRAVLATIRSRLLTVDGVDPLQVAWENESFEPTIGTDYIRETYIPGEEVQSTNGQTMLVGITQYDIVIEVGSGSEAANDLALQITKAFRPSQSITEATTVIITGASRLPARRAELGRYTVPVEIRWRAHAPLEE